MLLALITLSLMEERLLRGCGEDVPVV